MYKKLLLICATFAFFGCSKDDEGLSATEKKALLSSSKWEIEDVNGSLNFSYSMFGISGKQDSSFNVLENYSACVKDASYEFLTTGIVQFTPEITYCGEEQDGTLNYTTNEGVTELILSGDISPMLSISDGYIPDNQVKLVIKEISDSKLKLDYVITGDDFLQQYGSMFMLDELKALNLSIKGGMVISFDFRKI